MAQRSVRFHPQAEEEVQRAYSWYRERNPTAARAFLVDLDHAVLRVTEAPERWPFYHGQARRYIFQRFPFSLIYRVTDEIIDVIAVAHHRRRPGYWSNR
jgi:plasmid stabilization system protein ParE